MLTALASYLDARSARGVWRIRIDDLDPPRVRPGAEDVILSQLEAHGLEWDGVILHQADRVDRYQAAIERLITEGRLFACTCTRRDRARRMTSRGGCVKHCDTRKIPFIKGETALRLSATGPLPSIVDRIKGPYAAPVSDPQDLIVLRRDGLYAYDLATVIDDADSEVNHVVRGEDLMASTPAQISLQKALGLKTPCYAHTPLVCDAEGRKLSKSAPEDTAAGLSPSRTLERLLSTLGHPPPPDMHQAPVRDLLAWAAPRWTLHSLANRPAILAETLRAS